MGKTLDDLRKEGLVSVGPPLIQTAEDARIQYLRGVIDEDQLKEILAYHGQKYETVGLTRNPNEFEQISDGFERSLPDVEEAARDRLPERLARLEMKEEARKAALDAGPKLDDVKTENVAKVVVDPNQESKKAYEKVIEERLPKIEADKQKRVVSDLKVDVKEAQQDVKDAQAEQRKSSTSK